MCENVCVYPYDRAVGEIMIHRIGLCVTIDQFAHERLIAQQILPEDSNLRAAIDDLFNQISAREVDWKYSSVITTLNNALTKDFV